MFIEINSTQIIVIQIVDLNGILLSWWTFFFLYCVCVFDVFYSLYTTQTVLFFVVVHWNNFFSSVWLKFNVSDSLYRYFRTIFGYNLLTWIPKIIYTYLEKRFNFIGIFVSVSVPRSCHMCLLCSVCEISPVSYERVCS